MKPKSYLETTVISFYTAQISRDLITAGHQQVTREWWDNQLGRFTPYISEIVYEEIARGDQNAAQKRIKAVEGFGYLEINSEVLKLAKVYFDALDLSDKSRLDALHLALAVQHGMDYLVSWNFIHIVGARPRKIIDEINYQNGIKSPILCTPEELIEEC
ncbi:MAG: type II toxin-antitoxin system VapC family toxin [Planctomycetota bacterium]